MAPTYRMPDDPGRGRRAALVELDAALRAARCAAGLAGLATGEFAVRELLLTVVAQIDRAAAAGRRLA